MEEIDRNPDTSSTSSERPWTVDTRWEEGPPAGEGPAGPDEGQDEPGRQAESETPSPGSEATRRMAELEDAYRRLAADFLNYRRRMERDQANWAKAARGDLMKGFLEVFDTLELARASAEREETGLADLRNGLDMVLRRLKDTLAAQGIESVGAVGAPYDPTTCEAIGEDDMPDAEPGTVTRVLRAGYRMGDRLLRPALVRVAGGEKTVRTQGDEPSCKDASGAPPDPS